MAFLQSGQKSEKDIPSSRTLFQSSLQICGNIRLNVPSTFSFKRPTLQLLDFHLYPHKPLEQWNAFHMFWIVVFGSLWLSGHEMLLGPFWRDTLVGWSMNICEITYLAWISLGGLSSDHSFAISAYGSCSSLDSFFHKLVVASWRAPRNAWDPGAPPDNLWASSVISAFLSW